NQTVKVGTTNVILRVVATNSCPLSGLSYQWRFNGTNLVDGGNISGVTTPNLTISKVETNSAGDYSVVVMNLAGSTNSSNAHLTVNVAPSIAGQDQPQSQRTCPGYSVAFCVGATGTLPLHYQWRSNSFNIASATNNCL